MKSGTMRLLIGTVLLFCAIACGGGDETGTTPTSPTPTSPTATPITFSVRAEGTINNWTEWGGGATTLAKNGQAFFSKTGGAGGARGFTVATANATTGDVLSAGTNFDTWQYANQKDALVRYLDSIANGTLVLVGVADDAGFQSTSGTAAVIAALEKRGCTRIREYGFRDSYAVIFIAGETTPKAEAFSTTASVSIQYAVTPR